MSWKLAVGLTFYRTPKKSWEVKESLLGLVAVLTYIEVGKTGRENVWVASRREIRFLWGEFQSLGIIPVLRDDTEETFCKCVKALVLWGSPTQGVGDAMVTVPRAAERLCVIKTEGCLLGVTV